MLVEPNTIAATGRTILHSSKLRNCAGLRWESYLGERLHAGAGDDVNVQGHQPPATYALLCNVAQHVDRVVRLCVCVHVCVEKTLACLLAQICFFVQPLYKMHHRIGQKDKGGGETSAGKERDGETPAEQTIQICVGQRAKGGRKKGRRKTLEYAGEA